LVERHLVLQECTLRPSSEWTPQYRGWIVARVAEGIGYWLQGGKARELNTGDGFVVGFNASTLLRSSQLGHLKLQFFTVQPHYLSGLLTVAEGRQLEVAPNNPSSHVLIFGAGEPIGQKFARLAEQTPNNRLSTRCALLQLWVGAVAGLMAAPVSESAAGGNKLHERFRQLVGKMTEAELAETSLSDLARQLHCSERHLSRLFHGEFGVPLRARQIELRLQHSCQLLATSDAKILDIAYDSGFRHLGLFNAMFKKRFGATPSDWRRQNMPKNPSTQTRGYFSRAASGISTMAAMLCLFFASPAFGQTNPTGDWRTATPQTAPESGAHETNAKTNGIPVSTNAGPRLKVEKYLVEGNSILSPETIAEIFTNNPDAFGTNVTFGAIRIVLGDLDMAYRERGFVTVSVGLPQQKLTNGTVRVQVTEGRLVAINVTGNHYYSSNSVMRALPSLRTNILLNSKVLQSELDAANASRDRQIYPVIGPGPDPGTSELTLKVKDQFPLHVRLELNNQATPNTPPMRNTLSVQYDNLWDLEHQIGFQYNYTFEQFKGHDNYTVSPFDDPLIANYSAYYRIPLGGYSSVQEQLDANPGSFGYSEVTHRFNLPPATGRPELTFYASRSTSDTGVQRGPSGYLTPPATFTNNGTVYVPISLTTNSAGDNVTLTEDLGAKLSMPLPQMGIIAATFSFGADLKLYREASYNTNENSFRLEYTNPQGQPTIIPFSAPQPLTNGYTSLDYLPLNAGLNGSIVDPLGTSFFNAQVNVNALPFFSTDKDFAKAAYTTNAHAHYVTAQLGADRVETIYKDWSVKLHADGQWANGALFSNEQFAMGGTAGVRGYTDGAAYGDTGWRFSIEPQTPIINIGQIGNKGQEGECWIRGSVFMDYGQIYTLYDTPAVPGRELSFLGTGWSLTANIGNHLDARLTAAWPLLRTPATPVGDVHVYFGIGAQF
jgi:hemolysin activation/secretion protein/AraC-like DNA-binding protein